jgi:hypothetical protein
MRLLKFKTSVASTAAAYSAKKTYRVSEPQASQFIAAGYAVAVEEPKPDADAVELSVTAPVPPEALVEQPAAPPRRARRSKATSEESGL